MQPENANDPYQQPNPEVGGGAPAEPAPSAFNPFATVVPVSNEPVVPTEVAPAPAFQPSPPDVVAPVAQPEPSYGSASAVPVPVAEPTANVSDLTLYLVVLFSGLSTIASASYMAWTVLTHFMTEPSGFSMFDFSTFNIYVLLYLVLFGTLNVLASLRLEKRVKEQGIVGGSLSTVGAIWRALLVVWGVSAVVGILYAPLSATIAEKEAVASSITIDIVSALFALALIAVFFWRDMLLHKVRSALIPTAVVAVLVALVASVGAFATLNPKKATNDASDMYDYSSSFDSGSSESSFDTATDDETSSDAPY